MAAGLGFKTFTSGEVLTAADVNGYLMQGVGVFTDAANRDAEITSPQEGQFAYLKDTNVTTYYTGSAWTNLDTTGMVNPMTTTGDTIYSSSGSTPARLGIGSTGQVLTVSGGIPSWATPAGGGGMTSIASGSFGSNTTNTITLSSIPQTYNSLVLRIENVEMFSGTASALIVRANNDATSNQQNTFLSSGNNTITNSTALTGLRANAYNPPQTSNTTAVEYYFPMYADTNLCKIAQVTAALESDDTRFGYAYNRAVTAAITSLVITTVNGNNFDGGTYILWGVK